MKTFVPDYYFDFRCLAGACGHTCCEGWEIDIDEDTLKKYESVSGEFGRFLRESVSLSPAPHFRLMPGERCPFLTESRLCGIILQKGEDYLCQICRDHPRFRSFWSDRIEMGLGLACEEAARLILTSDHPLRLVELESVPDPAPVSLTEDELWLMDLRDRLLAAVPGNGPAARLQEYMIFRHLADALYDGLVEERIRFVDDACSLILAGWDGRDLEPLISKARQFSNEIEYDDEKLKAMILRGSLENE